MVLGNKKAVCIHALMFMEEFMLYMEGNTEKKISVSRKKEEFKDEPVFWCLKSNNCSTKGVLITPLSGFLLLCGRSYRQEAESTVGSIRVCETIRFQWKNSLR